MAANFSLSRRALERLLLLAATALLGAIFYLVWQGTQTELRDVPLRTSTGRLININTADRAGALRNLLQKGFYFSDPRDVDLIYKTLQSVPDETMDNIGELNKRRYQVPLDVAARSGGESFLRRVSVARMGAGLTGADSLPAFQKRVASGQLSSAANLSMGGGSITGAVANADGVAQSGVVVRLRMVLPPDSTVGDAEGGEMREESPSPSLRREYWSDSGGVKKLTSLTAYTRTAGGGEYSFTGLQEGQAYELLPLAPGYLFGGAKGVSALEDESEFDFTQTEHRLRLFSGRDFNILKKEDALSVRTPQDWERAFYIILAAFFGGFWFLHLFFSWKFRGADPFLLPLVMLLVGISFVTLLSLQDPLRDRMLAYTSLRYLGFGLGGFLLLSFFDLRKFTTDSGLFRMFLLRGWQRGGSGLQWAALAMGLLVLTLFVGTGPEGSGVKVNLLGFQPSELVKFLICVFLAAFFARNERLIAEYRSWSKRWTFFSTALLSILLLIFLFLILGDLGPAIVVCFTFIILFSFSRGDFGFMAGVVGLYVLLLFLLKSPWIATGIVAVLLVGSAYVIRKSASESAIMAVTVIAAFMLIDQIPFLETIFPGQVGRLIDRKAIWLDAWNNEVYGGDHVANGIWAMASGGISGQGIGEGFAKTIPEAHTDMILPALGEEMGWMGIACICILFLIYLHRCILVGRNTARPFLFYLCAGIGISTFIQFVLIAGGSTGALPLSGVALPFVSYGGTSLVINLLAVGFVFSASGVRGSAVQREYLESRQDKNLVPALLVAIGAVALLVVNITRYLVRNEAFVVKPALVADRDGARMFSYNPRIQILMNRLQAGALKDRRGLILASSSADSVRRQWSSLTGAVGGRYNLDSAVYKRSDRFYPFGADLFFWLGNANTGIFNGGTNGYFAEYEHAAELRGFNTRPAPYSVVATRYRAERFLAPTQQEMTVVKQDFSPLAKLLLAGIYSPEVDSFKRRNRDVHLTVDAALQRRISASIASDDSLTDNRVSVVVMHSATGDVLASSMYPLPPVNDPDRMGLTLREQNALGGWMNTSDPGFTLATQPGSTAKLLTATAAFKKLGPAAANKTFVVRPGERIRTGGYEPDETGTVGMERAIVKSNNVYFIKLANEEKLAEEMGDLYLQTGMFLRGRGGYHYRRSAADSARFDDWRGYWRKTEFRSAYNPNDIRRHRARGLSGAAWGQGELIATPAAVARLVNGLANNGILMPNRYVWKLADSLLPLEGGLRMVDSLSATRMQTYMIRQSENKTGKLGIAVGGKTGTPERILKGTRINDGWYVFFAPAAAAGKGFVTVCIRIERTKGSSDAVKLAGKHVIPALLQAGYIRGLVQNAAGAATSAAPTVRDSTLRVRLPRTNNRRDTSR